MNKELMLLNEMEEIRQKVAEHPEHYPVDYTIRLLSAIVAQYAGYESRTDWTDKLKKLPESRYYQRYHGDASQFHI